MRRIEPLTCTANDLVAGGTNKLLQLVERLVEPEIVRKPPRRLDADQKCSLPWRGLAGSYSRTSRVGTERAWLLESENT